VLLLLSMGLLHLHDLLRSLLSANGLHRSFIASVPLVVLRGASPVLVVLALWLVGDFLDFSTYQQLLLFARSGFHGVRADHVVDQVLRIYAVNS